VKKHSTKTKAVPTISSG